ncbi:carbohydrate-binding domain-containing protein [Christensenellaceae bacterium OttesenSCG-928-L17]|nr:carbohydrate-binding domain-containing protein [Christensenellaceae bacterium OttesenSCG-928-L17]
MKKTWRTLSALMLAVVFLAMPMVTKADGVIEINNLGPDDVNPGGWEVSGGGTVLTITENGRYTITMQSPAAPTNNRIVVQPNLSNVTLILSDVHIIIPNNAKDKEEALGVYAGSTVSIILRGDNTLEQSADGDDKATVLIHGDVTISGDGSLYCSTTGNAISIAPNSSLTIQSGVVTAISLDKTKINSKNGFAGIYMFSASSSLLISGGTVTAKGGAGFDNGYGAAGIGSKSTAVGRITITGGIVTATGGAGGENAPEKYGYDIGSGGGGGDAGIFTLNGNALVTLTTYGRGTAGTGTNNLLNGKIVDHSTGDHNIGKSYGRGYNPTTDTGPDDPVRFSPRTRTDAATGVTVSGEMTSGARLTVRERVLHAEGVCPACDEIRVRQAAGALIVLYDIAVTGGYTGELEVSIPVGEQYNGQTVTILHCVNKKLESVTCTVQNGMATGNFEKLSPFAVVQGTSISAPTTPVVNPPKTGDANSHGMVGVALILCALAQVAVIRRKHRSLNR